MLDNAPSQALDFEDGRTDGAPLLGTEDPWYRRKNRYKAWAHELRGECERLRADVESEQPSVFD